MFTRRQFLRKAGILGCGMALAGPILAACGPTPAPTAAPKKEVATPKPEEKPKVATPEVKPPAKKEAATVRYLSWWGQYNTGCFPQVSKEFQEKFPNITVKLEEVTQSEAAQKYPTTLVAGTAADILYHENYMSKYYDEGYILDITDRFKADGFDYARDFYQGLGIDEWRGRMFGFPHMFETCIMMYNKDAVKKHWGKDLWEAFPDGNWQIDDMLEVAKACTKDLDGDKKIDQWGLYIYHRSYYYGYEYLSWTMGDNCFDVPKMKFNFTSPMMKQITHMVLDWVRKDGFVITEEEASEVNKAASVTFPFLAGKEIMRIRMVPDVGRALATIKDRFKWDLFYLPNYKGNLAITRAGGHGNNIYAKTKVPDETYEFCKWMGTSPGMRVNAKTKASVPIYRRDPELRKFYETKEPEHDNVIMGVLEDRGGYGDHLRFHNEGEVRAHFQKQCDLLYTQPYAEAKAKLDDMMKKLEAEMNQMIDYGKELPFPNIKFPFKPPK